MPETSPSNADALVLATAFPHATEAQQNAILTDLFVRRVVIPKGAELAAIFARYAARNLREGLRDRDFLAGINSAIEACDAAGVSSEAVDIVRSMFAAMGAAPEASPPVEQEHAEDGPVYEVNVPRVVDLDDERVAETRVFLLCGDIVPGTLKAESSGDVGCLHFACDVKRGEHTRRVEGAVPSPATRAGYAPAGAMVVSLGPNPYQFCVVQPVGAFLDHSPVPVVGEVVPRPCDGAASNEAKAPTPRSARRARGKHARRSTRAGRTAKS